MKKPCYEEYANKAFWFYARNPALSTNQPGLNKADIDNWNACNDAMRTFTRREQSIITEVYRSKCALVDAVDCVATSIGVDNGFVWQLLGRCTKTFARIRGLI